MNLFKRFTQVVARNSNGKAIVYAKNLEFVSYRRLLHLTENCSKFLISRNCKKGDVIAVFHNKSTEAYATMLACIRLGLIYTNLDDQSPWGRLEKILDNSNPTLIIVFNNDNQNIKELKNKYNDRVVQADGIKLNESSVQDSKLPSIDIVEQHDPAYIMYTSGSTGTPKGAVITNQNLLVFIDWALENFNIKQEDRLTNLNPMYFDNSVFDFYLAFFSGATLVPFLREEVKKPKRLLHLINKSKCTIWFSVPSLLVYLTSTKSFDDDSLMFVRKILFGGEGFPKKILLKMFRRFSSRIEFENVYGPTECTCICSSYKISEKDFEDMQELPPLGVIPNHF
ncbi:AMP-binding protein, partial [Prochlorococcus sp. MIT 1303]|uniref:AMP-binding protein n=1 Tax=Prochlorococcus sp. MIT 1303 TaxID=1723647 RepID=UPI000A4E3941